MHGEPEEPQPRTPRNEGADSYPPDPSSPDALFLDEEVQEICAHHQAEESENTEAAEERFERLAEALAQCSSDDLNESNVQFIIRIGQKPILAPKKPMKLVLF